MENQNNRLNSIWNTAFNSVGWLLDLVVLLAITLFFVIRLPAVQTRAVHKASEILSKKLSHEVSIDRVDIAFFKSIVLDKVKVLDYKNEVLFYVDKLEADISLFNIFQPNKLHLANLTLSGPRANLIKYQGSDSLNMRSFLRSINKLLTKKDTLKTKTPFDFKIDAVTIQNGRFTYNDQNKPRTKAGIDYQHMVLDSIYGKFTEINLGDTVSVRVTGLHTVEVPTQTRLHNLGTHMAYAPTFWEFEDLDLRLGKSNLAHYLRFDYNQFSNFQQFNDSVTVTANLKKTHLYSDDIANFAPQIKKLEDKIALSGDIKGKLKRFNARNLDLRYGQHTHVVGNISASGLPAVRETFLELDLRPSVLFALDLKKYIPAKSYVMAQRLGKVKLNGNFVGFYNDFVANGSFVTALGKVESDINVKINKQTNASAYSGYLKTDNFKLGTLLNNNKLVSTISIDGRIKGSGFTLPTANLSVNAKIKAVTIKGLLYRNIVVTNATLQNQLVNGDFQIRDSNINLTATGQVNLDQAAPAFNLSTKINHLNLKGLGFSKEDISLKTEAELNFTGLTLDAILGTGDFYNTTLTLKKNKVFLDSVLLNSNRKNGKRSLTILSEIADITADGNWNYTTLIKDLGILIKEYRLNFESNDRVTNAYYRNKKKVSAPEYEVNYTLKLKKINPVVQAFVPILKIANNTLIDGSFRKGANTIFTFFAHADTVYYGKNHFYQNDIEFNTSKLPYSPDVLANASILSRTQVLSTGGRTENLLLEGAWNDRTILFTSNIAQTNTTNRASLSGVLAFLNDKLQIVFNTSNIKVLDKEWQITPNNTIEISGQGKEINFKDFSISHEEQRISIKGLLSKNPANILNAELSNFRLETLNPLFKQKFRGILNGTLAAQDIYSQPILTSKLTGDSLYMDNYFVGAVAGTSDWDNAQKRLSLDLGLTRENMKVLNITGFYNPDSEEKQLDLLAVMDEAPIKLIEPLLSTLFGDLSGTMQGRLNITGKVNAPILAGSALVTDGRFNFKYLNTVYTFTDRISFTENDITFKDIKLRDILNNTGILSGSIIHQNFKDMILDLRGTFTKFMVLNTTRENNKLYYGTAIATGEATVLGSPTNLSINIEATSEAGTRMSIPLDNNTTVSRQNFIRFVNRNSTDSLALAAVKAQNQVDLAGINMNFNLNITPDAYLEIILDQTTGDIVRGSGNGRINMNIDTRGEFTMEGQVEIARGAYNFTLYDIVNKEFIIRPGGTITWNGDPYTGIMRITAAYTQTVPIPASLIAQNGTSSGGAGSAARIPVTAIMNLTGNLLTPEIRLDLEFNNTPSDLEAQLAPYLADIRNDQEELNRQVFSLLILKRLSERNTFGGSGTQGTQAAFQQGIQGTLGELVTNQLGNLLSQLDNNLEVDIGLSGGLDENALNNLQVRLSYSLLEGRLRVSREGGFSNGTPNPTNPTDPNPEIRNGGNLAGDWRVEYYLGQNGKVRARLEYITSQQTFNTNNTSTTRISLLHTEQFDNLGELFARKRLRRKYLEQKKTIVPLDDDERYDQIK